MKEERRVSVYEIQITWNRFSSMGAFKHNSI